MKYSIILPTYNEKENLPIMVWLINKSCKENNINYEIVIVDDNSPDGTRQIAENLKNLKEFKDRITIVSRPGKMGLGSAYLDGLKSCTGEFVFLMDADLSHHPKHIPEFVARQEATQCDIVTGTRYAHGGGTAGWDLVRVFTSRGANLLANLLVNPGVSDLTGSFRLYKKEVLVDLVSRVKGKAYVFQMEIIVRAKNYGPNGKKPYSVEEVPIIFVDRIYGESKLGAMEVVSYAKYKPS